MSRALINKSRLKEPYKINKGDTVYLHDDGWLYPEHYRKPPQARGYIGVVININGMEIQTDNKGYKSGYVRTEQYRKHWRCLGKSKEEADTLAVMYSLIHGKGPHDDWQ